MSRFLLTAASIFALLFTNFMLPVRTLACDEKMPETLLSLYRNSEAIYVSRYRNSEEGEVTSETEDYKVFSIRKHFDVASTLKGESRKMFVLDDEEYRYTNVEAASDEESAESEEHAEFDPYSKVEPGDLVLLFLKKSEDGKSLIATDYRDGIKKIADGDLASYEARIRDLNSIFSAKKVNDADIVEWLIKCVEDPATRWEGAFELNESFGSLEWKAEQARQAKEEPAAAETETEETPAEHREEPEQTFDNSIYASIITDAQKQRLTNILINSERSRKSDDAEKTEPELSRGDHVLIELVKRWGDARLASFMLTQLRNSSDEESYNTSSMMDSIANILKDDKLTEIAERYREIAYEEADTVVENGKSEDAADKVIDEDAAVEEGDQAEPAVEGDTADEPADDIGSNGEEAKKLTYRQLRAELINKFTARAEIAISKDEAASAKVTQ